MELIYNFETVSFDLESTDEIDFDTEQYCYKIGLKDIKEALKVILFENVSEENKFKGNEKQIAVKTINYIVDKMLDCFENDEEIFELTDCYYEDIKNYFRDEAREEWSQNR